MRKVYKNPRELATCLKDNVEQYLDGIITYEKLEERINTIIDANLDRVYKNGGSFEVKISNIIGATNMEYINKIRANKEN